MDRSERGLSDYFDAKKQNQTFGNIGPTQHIEEMSAFSPTPFSLASLSRASSKSLSIRIVLSIVFFLSFLSVLNSQ
jgi:hypothetical protein